MNRVLVLLAALALLAGCADPEGPDPAPEDAPSSPATSDQQGAPDDPEAPLMDRIEAAIELALRDG